MKLNLISNPSNASDDIYNVVAQNCDFYVDKNNEAFLVSYINNDYTLVYLSNADSTKQFFIDLYFDKYNKTVRKADVITAYDTICAVVMRYKQLTPVYTRVGYNDGKLYYDLMNQDDEVVVIDTYADDITITQKANISDIFFYQDQTMNEQVEPVLSDYGLLDFIDEFINVDKTHKLLLAVYLCAAFIPDIKHPILIAEGEKGAGKTNLLTFLSLIINPVAKDVLVLPKKEDNLITALSNNYFSAFDNIGKLSKEFCNIFCQASTGGTLIKRKLYSDNREICINIKRLVALNGINLQISQSDLLDRAIMLSLNRIDEKDRLPEEILYKNFKNILPNILADIFSILSKALAIYPNVNLNEYPRMADFSRYGYAIAEAIETGKGIEFIEEYKRNIKLATESAVRENHVLNSLREFVDEKQHWKGTMTALHNELQKKVRNLYINKSLPASFPNNPNSLSRMLNTHKHELRNLDIDIDIGRATDRYIEITKINNNSSSVPTIATTKNDTNTESRKTLLDENDD